MRISILFSLFLLSFNLFSQKADLIDNQALHFKLEDKKEMIDFIVADTTLTKKKPIFLFCQGSLPIPLFIDFNEDNLWLNGGGISNFDINSIRREYHLVIISMPKTPLVVNKDHLNNQMCYVPDTVTKSFSAEFYHSDKMENYLNRANIVLNFLKTQSWVSNEKVVVFGHSQGSKIATKLASGNKSITHVGLAGANPFGRIDQMIREERRNVQNGSKTWQEAEKSMDYWYEFWRYINYEDIEIESPDLISWKSFSKPTYEDLLKIEIPIYLTYGTEDITSDLCDILPVLFISHGKENLTLKRRIGLDHNYFELNEKGQPNYDKCHWNDVVVDFAKWINEN